VRWTEREDFGEIYISPSMLVDHFPYNVANALEVAAASYDIALDKGRIRMDETPERHTMKRGDKKDA
jgi:hypothetical protein